MGETQGTVRTTISIPPSLKREMEAVKESVNWSGVAAEAFRRKLLELQSTRKGTKMEDVVKRLKAAKKLEENEAHTAGLAAGTQWAKEDAKPSQLERLEAASPRGDCCECFRNPPGAFGWAGVVYRLIHGEDFDGRAELHGFWDLTLGDDAERINEKSFADGFVSGALEVWVAVKDQLDCAEMAEEFRKEWESLNKVGACDGLGGMECLRVYQEWLAADKPADVRKFIRWRANLGPHNTPSGW